MELYGSAVGLTKAILSRFGLSIERRRPVRDPVLHMAAKMQELGIETLIDVGANTGQFAQAIRAEGFSGDIYSFEPLSAAHAACCAAAERDGRWKVMPRMALGAVPASAEINVSINLASSSLLDVEQRSIDAAPASGFSGKEQIEIMPLDDIADPTWRRPLALKIDTQGFEREVLAGARLTLMDVALVLVELSLTPLYKNGPGLAELYGYLEARGFRCIGLTQGFADHRRNELLQVDGVFVRQAPAEATS
jgi:FkbM family methyltransferase